MLTLMLSIALGGEPLMGVDPDNSGLPMLPTQNWTWQEPPVIVNCTNSKVTSNRRIQKALDFLAPAGVDASNVIKAECSLSCVDVDPGTILIRKPGCAYHLFPGDGDFNVYGLTYKVATEDRKHIKWAVIEIDRFDQTILVHEIAHAYGWQHAALIDGVMHPYHSYMGKRMNGMTQ